MGRVFCVLKMLQIWFAFLGLVGLCSSETIPLQLILDATSEEVHYIKGWLEAPSYMDLTEMKFVTTTEPDWERGDDDLFEVEDDDDFSDDMLNGGGDDDDDDDNDDYSYNDDETSAPTEGEGGGNDTTPPTPGTDAPTVPSDAVETPAPTEKETEDGGDDETTTTPAPEGGGDDATPAPAPTGDDGDGGGNRTRILDDGASGGMSQRTSQIVDFVVFLLPEDCAKNEWGGCVWAALGVGAYDDEVEGGVSFCCSEDTVAREICDAEDLGKLIVDHDIFTGDHRTVEVPTEDDAQFQLDDPIFKQDVSGDYIMVLGNCDDYGMDVLAVGNMEWKSVRGNLPGELYDLMLFYVALTLFYLLLVVWYGCGMRMFQEAAIPIQKYIAATMILGLLELSFRALDLGIWNARGFRSENIAYVCKFRLSLFSLIFTFLESQNFGLVPHRLRFGNDLL